MNNKKLQLFTTAFFQVFFVSTNVWCIANRNYIAAFISSFAISYLWTINVRKIVISAVSGRIIYASGAAAGCIGGILMGQLLSKI